MNNNNNTTDVNNNNYVSYYDTDTIVFNFALFAIFVCFISMLGCAVYQGFKRERDANDPRRYPTTSMPIPQL